MPDVTIVIDGRNVKSPDSTTGQDLYALAGHPQQMFSQGTDNPMAHDGAIVTVAAGQHFTTSNAQAQKALQGIVVIMIDGKPYETAAETSGAELYKLANHPESLRDDQGMEVIKNKDLFTVKTGQVFSTPSIPQSQQGR